MEEEGKKSYTSAIHLFLKPSSELNVFAHSVLLSHWCLWVGDSLCSWNWTDIAKHLSVSAWQNLTVPVLANRSVLAEAFLVAKYIWDC